MWHEKSSSLLRLFVCSQDRKHKAIKGFQGDMCPFDIKYTTIFPARLKKLAPESLLRAYDSGVVAGSVNMALILTKCYATIKDTRDPPSAPKAL